MLGPVTHVTTQSAIASALWHPLGKNGSCIVTITEDSAVRLWELDMGNRKTFETPTLSIDLRKLADATSIDQDFGASKLGTSKGFSPDSFDMEVASACFGERDSGGWSSMTLWIAMREGDVYALCPLLPEKWTPTPLLMASLSVSIVSKATLAKEDPELSEQEKLTSKQQWEWMQDLDIQDPTMGGEEGAETETYLRPARPGKIPKLQGPFDIEFQQEEGDDEDFLLSDIFAISARVDTEELMFGEEDSLVSDEADHEGLSLGIICLLTNTGRVTICLDLDGVEAQWLPHNKTKSYHSFSVPEDPSLLAFQALETLRQEEVDEESWPMFSADCSSRYSFFVTSTSSISFVSLSPWVFRLESELRAGGSTSDGLAVRLGNLVRGPDSTRERIYPGPGRHSPSKKQKTSSLANSLVLRDPDLGYLLLSATNEGPITIGFDSPELAEYLRPHSPTFSQSESEDLDLDRPLQLCEPRVVYQTPQALEMDSTMPILLEKLRHSKYKRLMNEHVRLSPATLDVMTDAHKVVSEESDRIREAAAELFRRCQRLQIELKDQIQKANEVARRVEEVAATPKSEDLKDSRDDESKGEKKMSSNEIIEARIKTAKEKQVALMNRLDSMRTRIMRGTEKELSGRERAWIEEVQELERHVKGANGSDSQNSQQRGTEHPSRNESDDDDATEDGKMGNNKQSMVPWKRFEEVMALKEELIAQAKEVIAEDKDKGDGKGGGRRGSNGSASPWSRSHMRVPSDVRKQKVSQIMEGLAREQALVENTRARLESLAV